MVVIEQDIKTSFPHDEFRPYQEETIIQALKAFETKSVVILEAPTGAGKTAIAITLGNIYKSAYILTSQKILQDQYTKDYVNDTRVVGLKGKSNYSCVLDEKPCSLARCVHQKKRKCESCKAYMSGPNGDPFAVSSRFNCFNQDCYIKRECRARCPYVLQVAKGKQSDILILNYSNAMLLKDLKDRTLLVCDECHNIEEVFMNQISFTLSQKRLNKLGLEIQMPLSLDGIKEWVEEELSPMIDQSIHKISDTLETMTPSDEMYTMLAQNHDTLEQYVKKLENFIDSYHAVKWIACNEKDEDKDDVITFKPLFISHFTNQIFKLGHKILLMSATVLNRENFCHSIGVDKNMVEFIQTPSTFPKENRPIMVLGKDKGIKLSKDYIDANLPKLTTLITRIINDRHPNQKGIIHTHTYKIANYIRDNIKDDRLLFHNSRDRGEIYEYHLTTKKPTILVSPSMTEGIDLHDDLSRFQIICKIPMPYLGDKQIRERKDLDPEWYNWKTCLAFVQAYGRSIRSVDDWAKTYVVDSLASWFIMNNKHQLPGWFLEAIKYF